LEFFSILLDSAITAFIFDRAYRFSHWSFSLRLIEVGPPDWKAQVAKGNSFSSFPEGAGERGGRELTKPHFLKEEWVFCNDFFLKSCF
jgi:hypothetical protein